ncbi:MAG: autotransporter outer membrane beta-barrel domain-containing protein, partial [Campylobacteraceae bacterium]|nr:autotransporter outer membrane beta-barrel domain-containing protein [Campylobacteraceae bacterium]
VQIRETSQGIFGDNLTIITHGNTAAALENYDRSNVTIGNNALIATLGNNSHAVHTLPYTAAGEANTVIGSGSVISTQGDGSHALFVEGKSVTVGARIILNTDTNISALGVGSYAVYSNNTNGLVFTNSSAKLNIFGDIAAQNGGNVDLGLSNGSYLYGNTNSETGVISLAFDGSGSLWKLKGSSSLTNLSLTNNAKVDLTQSASYATLSIDNLKGSGIFHQRINPIGNGDLIVINNSSSGNHKLTFDDSALGGYIVEGNESFIVVQQNQSGTHNANFSGEAYIGAYTYYVVHVNNTQYLAADASVIGGNGSGGGGVPVLNSAALSSVSFANINYISNYANTQTLLQRLGELGLNRDTLDDIWVRAYAGKLDSFDAKFEVQDADYYGLQAGFDRVYDMNNGRLFAGFTFGLSKTNIDYKLGDGSVDSYDIGLYASYKNDNNFYADTLLKYTRNKNEFDIITPNSVEITASSSANAYSLSFEGGKRFSIGGGFYIEPQAEFTFSRQPAGTSVASSGLKTKFDSYNSILGRAGAVAGYSLKDETNIYYKTGYIKEFDGDVSYSFNDESAKQTYKLNGSIFDNAIGVVSTINKVHHLYFEGTYQVGNSFDNKKANFGYKYSF